MNQAAGLPDKACRNTRQTALIAFNDTRKLVEQHIDLDRDSLASVNARDACRQQFDIGQRSLPDLLNAESERYTANRAYANGEHDLALAQAHTLASINELTPQLGIAPARWRRNGQPMPRRGRRARTPHSAARLI
jgi:outer membrane protein, adhesin transport system